MIDKDSDDIYKFLRSTIRYFLQLSKRRKESDWTIQLVLMKSQARTTNLEHSI